MATGYQFLQKGRIQRNGFLGAEGIGESLVMDSRSSDRGVDGHVEEEMLKGHLLGCGDDP